MGTLKLQSNGPLYSNTVIGTLAVDGWAVTFGTARRGLGGLRSRPVYSSLNTNTNKMYKARLTKCPGALTNVKTQDERDEFLNDFLKICWCRW